MLSGSVIAIVQMSAAYHPKPRFSFLRANVKPHSSLLPPAHIGPTLSVNAIEPDHKAKISDAKEESDLCLNTMKEKCIILEL